MTVRGDSVERADAAVQAPDRVTFFLRSGVLFLILCLLCVLIYGLVGGVFVPPSPRTQVESALLQAETEVAKDPGNGLAWAALAHARWQAGDRDGAWEAVERGRKSAKGKSILPVNNAALDFLLMEGENQRALDSAEEYLKVARDLRSEETSENLAKGIEVPEGTGEQKDLIRLYVAKATAQGNLKRWEDAVETLTQALELDMKAADIMTSRGWARLRAGDREGAIEDFEESLRFLPDDPSAKAGLQEAKNGAEGSKD